MEFSHIHKSCRSSPSKSYKSRKYFGKKLDVKDIKVPVKVRDIPKLKKKNCIRISDFGYENQEKHSIYVTRNCSGEEHFSIFHISY